MVAQAREPEARARIQKKETATTHRMATQPSSNDPAHDREVYAGTSAMNRLAMCPVSGSWGEKGRPGNGNQTFRSFARRNVNTTVRTDTAGGTREHAVSMETDDEKILKT
jgi:hypothetical protein